MSETEEALKFKDGFTTIRGKDPDSGEVWERQVVSRQHPMAPGLAVTMVAFGVFNVTHISTGSRMCGTTSRDGTAMHYMACFAAIAKANGFSWAELKTRESVKERIDAIGDRSVPFEGATWTNKEGAKPMTILEWIRVVGTHTPRDDFPWEAPSDDPIEDAVMLLESLRETA